ncbi:hypothetical protein B566_EDAN016030 [Ephemera danica]|nr:hypothetical protein B566_EDAN016030 [Ephemera danica]
MLNAYALQFAFEIKKSPSCSHNSDPGSATRSTRGAAATPSTSAGHQGVLKRKQILEEIMDWRIVPEEFLQANDPTMSQLYGAVHLARLMVKLPAFLLRTSLKKVQVPTIKKHLNLFVSFLTKRCLEDGWFGPQHYYIDLTHL